MKKKLQALIPAAIDTINAVEIPNNNIVPKNFKGYFASFGASIIQAGLLPTVIFFDNAENTEEKRDKICQAIWKMIQPKLDDVIADDAKDLKSYLISSGKYNDPRVLQLVTDHAIALKIALRTFKFSEE